ncbi:Ig-like domain-containing protein, partial [Methylobacterium sp. J-090]
MSEPGVQGDGVTSDQTPTLSGIGLAGATVTVAYATAFGPQTATSTVAANGTWRVHVPSLSVRAYLFTASLPSNVILVYSQPLAMTSTHTTQARPAATPTRVPTS